MNDKASPRPWFNTGQIVFCKINDKPVSIANTFLPGITINTATAWYNAKLIVEAVNNHDRLVAENERLQMLLVKYMNNHNCHYGGFGEDGIMTQPCELCEQARKALKGE